MGQFTQLIWVASLTGLTLASESYAATYTVSPTGNDTSAGTQTSPWKSLSRAATAAVAGDLISVLAGNYTDNTTVILKPGVSIQGAGKTASVISTTANTYIKAESAVPVINGSNEISGLGFIGSGSNIAITSVGRSNQKIHDCRFENFNMAIDISGKTALWTTGCVTTPPTQTARFCDDDGRLSTQPGDTDWATGVEIYNNEVKNGRIYPNTIKGAKIHHNTIDNSTSLKSGVGNTSLWWDSTEFYNNTITLQTIAWSTIALEVWMVQNDSKFYNNSTNSWFSILNNPNGPKLPYSWEILNNTFAGNVAQGIGSGAVGQALETCYYTENVLIAGNYFTNIGTNKTYDVGVGIHGKGKNNNFTIRNNVFYNIAGAGVQIDTNQPIDTPFTGSNINIYNNVFDTLSNGTSTAVYMDDRLLAGTLTGVTIKNNLFMKVSYGSLIYPSTHDVKNVVFTNNVVYGGNYTYDYGTGGFSLVANNYNFQPGIAASGARPDPFYRPTSTSNLIDKGVNVGLPFSGAAPDIGAYEFTPPSQPKTPAPRNLRTQ